MHFLNISRELWKKITYESTESTDVTWTLFAFELTAYNKNTQVMSKV